MDRNHIQSPVELDESGWRGRVRGVTRISSKAGFTAAIVLAALFGMIVYGVSTAGHRRASTAAPATLTKASEQQQPWWNAVPNAQASPPRLPSGVALPPRVPPLSAEAPAHVPAVAPVSEAQMQAVEAARERQQRQEALSEAADGAPVLVRMGEDGAPTPGMPQTAAALAPTVPGLMGSPQPQYPQDARASFLASAGSNASHDRLVVARQDDPSPYELHAGSVIPATLLTGINADLPGTILGQVRDDVLDSVTGTYLLIPRGTKLVGTYDSRIVQGERRVLVAWTRLLYPDGSSMDISGMAGTDPAGYSGLPRTSTSTSTRSSTPRCCLASSAPVLNSANRSSPAASTLRQASDKRSPARSDSRSETRAFSTRSVSCRFRRPSKYHQAISSTSWSIGTSY